MLIRHDEKMCWNAFEYGSSSVSFAGTFPMWSKP